MGVGAVEVGVEGIGWVSTLTLYLLLASMVLFLLSLALGPGAFLVMGLLFWAFLGTGAWLWLGQIAGAWFRGWPGFWDQAFLLVPNTVFIFQMREG